MTNDDPIGAATAADGAPAAPTEIVPVEHLAITALQGNATTLVAIAGGSNANPGEVVIVSRDRHARATFTPAADKPLVVPLGAGDYLLIARSKAPDRRSNRGIRQRVLVDAGRVYRFGMPRPLCALPATHPDPDKAAPVLTRLAYTGSIGGAARLVVEWSPGGAAHCLCIRSPQWGEQWLPYATPSAAAFCLSDGTYQIRDALFSDDGTRLGPWSDASEFVIAEGRLAAAPSQGGGDLLDWIAVKRGWRPAGAVQLRGADLSAGAAVDGTVAVRLAWQDAASIAGRRYVIAYCRERGGEWKTAIAACPEETLRLAPGRYRIRLCAVDDRVFLRSEFFAEGVLTVSPSDSPLLMPVGGPAPDSPVAWVPLPESDAMPDPGQGDALTEFVAHPIAALAGGEESGAIDLNALAYAQSPRSGTQNAYIAVTRALAQGRLAPDQMAAAGDYFVRTGRIEAARLVFEELGRRYRGVDYAQLRCAQLAAISGRDNEARELLTLALLPPRDDPSRGQILASAASTAGPSATNAGTRQGAPEDKAPQAELLAEMPALRFKAQQYDRLMREVPTLRRKAKLYDEAKGERTPGRGNGVVRLLRRWSGRLPRLRQR